MTWSLIAQEVVRRFGKGASFEATGRWLAKAVKKKKKEAK